MREQEERDRESRESPETKYDAAVRRESQEREDAAERVPEPPPPAEEENGSG